MKSEKKLNTTEGQDWIIKKIQLVGYKSDKNGICFGISHMAAQAFLSDDLDKFIERIDLIYKINANSFSNRQIRIKNKNKNPEFDTLYKPLLNNIKTLYPENKNGKMNPLLKKYTTWNQKLRPWTLMDHHGC